MTESLQPLLDKIGGARRAMIVAVGVGSIALIFGLSRWATAPEWVPAYTGVPLELVGKMTDKLDQAGIKYRLARGGADVLVATSDLARARVVLAREGLPSAGRPGLELFDQPSWGMTDFTQRVNYRRALEGELERTIGKMRGIESAQVHLALHESSSFRSADRPSEASVVLKLRGGEEPSRDIVQGIAHLVASSVDGLESEHVTVVDDSGRLLSEANDSGVAGLTSHQLNVQREVESYLETKAQQLVAQIVGAANAKVQVSATINFDKVERATQSVDPDKQATSTEQRSEVVPGSTGGAGSTNTATSYENSRSLETFSGAIGNVKRLSVAVLVNDKQVGPADKPQTQPRSPEELSRIEKLVRSAVGVDESRGDVISVVSVPFDATAPSVQNEPKPDLWSKVQEVQRPALSTLGLVLAFVVALLAIRSLRVPSKSQLATPGVPAPESAPALP